MIALLDSLSERARLAAAALIIGGFALVLVLPVGLGAVALVSSGQAYLSVQAATAQIEQRLVGFDADRADFQVEQAISDAEFEAYLDPVTNNAQFRVKLEALADALRSTGVAVAGETNVLERQLADGVVLLSADITVSGSLADVLTVLSSPDFAALRTEGAGFAAESSPSDVRGAIRFVSHHIPPEAGEGSHAP